MTVSYFADRPDVVKIFDDLDKFRNFCRFNAYKFDEANMYKTDSLEWKAYQSGKSNWPWGAQKQKPKFNNNGFKKPYKGKRKSN
jgi:hypothetical protein